LYDAWGRKDLDRGKDIHVYDIACDEDNGMKNTVCIYPVSYLDCLNDFD